MRRLLALFPLFDCQKLAFSRGFLRSAALDPTEGVSQLLNLLLLLLDTLDQYLVLLG